MISIASSLADRPLPGSSEPCESEAVELIIGPYTF